MRVFRNRAEAIAAGLAPFGRGAFAKSRDGKTLGPQVGIIRTELEAQLDEALEAVQWSGGGDTYTGPLCPSCGSNKASGHDQECRLEAALDAFRGE